MEQAAGHWNRKKGPSLRTAPSSFVGLYLASGTPIAPRNMWMGMKEASVPMA